MMSEIPHKAREHAIPRTDILFVIAVMVIYVSGYAFSTVIPDTARDVGGAWRIVHEGQWPLLGPEIGQRWHLGPIWFYALAPIVALAKSMTQVALAVGLLASLKFPLAYGLGRRLQGRELGLIWAALLALPGWASLEQVIFAHTNLVEAMTLATLLAATYVARGEGGATLWGLLGLCWSLAWHAHPTTIVLAPVIALAVWRGSRGHHPGRLLPWFAMAIGCLLPLVPMLAHEIGSGFAQLDATRDFVAEGAFSTRVQRVPVVLIGWFVHGFTLVRTHLFAAMPGWGMAVACFAASAIALGCVLALIAPGTPTRSQRFGAMAYLVVAMGTVALLRDAVSFYLLYVAVPLITGIAALGWATAVRTRAKRSREINVTALVTLCLIAALSLLQARRATWHDGWQWLPATTIADVGSTPRADELPVDYLPAFALDAWADEACAGSTLALAGDAVVLMDYAQTLPVLLRCGDRGEVWTGADEPRAGFPAALLRAAGSAATSTSHGYVWAPAKRVSAEPRAPTTRLDISTSYPPHPYRLTLDQIFRTETPLAPGQWLALTNKQRAFVATDTPVVTADQTPIAVAARSGNTWLYRVPAPATVRIEWRVGATEVIEALVFADKDLDDIVSTRSP